MQATIRPEDLLEDDLDELAKAQLSPAEFVVKGTFMTRLKDRLGPTWRKVERGLQKPPRFGHYVPFEDYPQRDHGVLTLAVAARCHRDVSPREALRRLGQDDFRDLAASSFGRLMIEGVPDVHAGLLKMPSVYLKVAPGPWEVRGTELDPSTVLLEWEPNYGFWEYQLGQIEGVLRHYQASYVIEFTRPTPTHLCFRVDHG